MLRDRIIDMVDRIPGTVFVIVPLDVVTSVVVMPLCVVAVKAS